MMIRKLSPEVYLGFVTQIERWQNNRELVSERVDINTMSEMLDYYQKYHYPNIDVFIEDAGIKKYSPIHGIINQNDVTIHFIL